MTTINSKYKLLQRLTTFLIGMLSVANVAAQTANDTVSTEIDADTLGIAFDDALPQYFEADTLQSFNEDSIASIYSRELLRAEEEYIRVDTYFEHFDPKPAKAVWMSALVPGGGQIYNRKYWKLPIIYGGFLGLIYGYNWNNRYYKTYQNAYRDLVTHSPNASYMQFLHMRDKEGYVKSHGAYLEKTFQRKRNTYRNWRDYCVVGMLGVYLVAMVDAYVDASLYHFDVSPELDAYNSPSMVVSYKIDF